MEELKSISLRVGNTDIVAAIAGMGKDAWVAVKPICETLGIDHNSQVVKLQKRPQFNCRVITVVAEDGKQREMFCISVVDLGMWLCGINPNRVNPEQRTQLMEFQRHLHIVVYEALSGNITPEKYYALEAALAVAMKTIAERDRNHRVIQKHQQDQIDELKHSVRQIELSTSRFESADSRAAASRLSHQRWANRDREQLH